MEINEAGFDERKSWIKLSLPINGMTSGNWSSKNARTFFGVFNSSKIYKHEQHKTSVYMHGVEKSFHFFCLD